MARTLMYLGVGFAAGAVVLAGLLLRHTGPTAANWLAATSAVSVMTMVVMRMRWMAVVTMCIGFGAAWASTLGIADTGAAYSVASILILPLYLLHNRADHIAHHQGHRSRPLSRSRVWLITGAAMVGGALGLAVPPAAAGLPGTLILVAAVLGSGAGAWAGWLLARRIGRAGC